MSVQAITAAYEMHPMLVAGIDSSVPLQKLVLVTLANYADRVTLEARPGINTLATDCDLNERSVQRALRALELQGLIERVRHHHGGRGFSTVYRINPGAPSPIEKGDTPSPLARKGDGKGGGDDKKGDGKGDGNPGGTPPDPRSGDPSDPRSEEEEPDASLKSAKTDPEIPDWTPERGGLVQSPEARRTLLSRMTRPGYDPPPPRGRRR